MPNHITTEIRSQDDGAMAALTALMVDHAGDFDFNKVIPMPDALKTVHLGGTQIDGVHYHWWRTDENGNNIGITDEEVRLLTEKYGAADWYNWAYDHWDTKWNAYDCQCDENIISFSTAWAHPEKVIRRMSEMLPDYSFDVQFADENIGYNTGDYTIKAGEVIAGSVYFDDDSPEAWENSFIVLPGCRDFYRRLDDDRYELIDD